MDPKTQDLCLATVKALTPEVLGDFSPFAGLVAASHALLRAGLGGPCAISDEVRNENSTLTLSALGLIVGEETIYFSGPNEWRLIDLKEGCAVEGTDLLPGWKWVKQKSTSEHHVFVSTLLAHIYNDEDSKPSLQSKFDTLEENLGTVVDRYFLENQTQPEHGAAIPLPVRL